ncbi:MAG: exo-beta-N-acetylmuramidase NamZ domain-containing protein [Akkermansiaceae bacterium]
MRLLTLFLALPALVTAEPKIGPLLNGIDVLKRDNFKQLRGCHIGLITNHTGIDRKANSTIDLLHSAPSLKLVALFSPEHGIRGELDQEKIGDTTDKKTGLPVYSLYGKRRSPSPAQLKGIDTLVLDIQDIGCRFYTYISTMSECLEAAEKSKIRFVVLDRVNPIGSSVEGPVLNEKRSFVATHEIPIRHGMTVGELARLISAERKFGTELGVIRCEGGSPLQWFDTTGLPWRNPSPNMRSLTAATLYPGVGLLEFCKISVGRGTDTPFEWMGAPYIDEIKLAADLNAAALPGVKFTPVRFTPDASVFADKECRGVRFEITNRGKFQPIDLGVTLATILNRDYPDAFGIEKLSTLLCDKPTLNAIRANKPLPEIRQLWKSGLELFEKRRHPHLLYAR